MSELERRYRHALRWYPTAWRSQNGDVAVGTLLDLAEKEGRTRPARAEIVSLAAHGFAERVRTLPLALSVDVRARVSTAALGTGAAASLTAVMQLESRSLPEALAGFDFARFGPFLSPAIIVYLAWLVAFLLALGGLPRAARWTAAATIPLALSARAFADAAGMDFRPTWTFFGLLICLAVLVLGGPPAPARRGAIWLLAWFVPTALAFSVPSLLHPTRFAFQVPLWLESPALPWVPLIAVASAVVAAIVRLDAWPAPILLVGLPFTAAAVLNGRPSVEIATMAVALAAAVLALWVLVRALGFRIRFERVETAPPISQRG